MALSNWLTRNEWNACFFLGANDAVQNSKPCNNLGDRLRLGIGVLHRLGYEFTGIESTEDGDYEKVEMCCGSNASVLAEMIDGSFDPMSRAKELLEWSAERIPHYDISWLKDGVEGAEKSKPENPPVDPAIDPDHIAHLPSPSPDGEDSGTVPSDGN